VKRLLLVLAVSACAEAAPLEVPRAAIRAGQVCEAEERSASHVKMGREAFDEREHTRSTIKVLEADGTVATHVEVTYTEHTVDGAAGALHGKTYDVRVDAAGLHVARPDGTEPSRAERSLVADDHRELGRPAALGGLLASRPWRAWHRVDLDDDELADIARARADEGMTPEAGSFTYTGRRGDTAWFQSTLRVLRTDGRMRVTARLTGTIEMDLRTGVITSITSHGTMDGTVDAESPLPVRGTLETTSLRRCQ
jgi:hypothetical protein